MHSIALSADARPHARHVQTARRSAVPALSVLARIPPLSAGGDRIRPTEARDVWLDAASRLHALDYESLARLTVTLLEHQRYGDAAEFAACVWRIEPDVAALAFNCGYALQMGGRHAEAIAPYRRVLELMPDWPSLRNNLAIAVRITGGDPAEELALLEQAVAANPRDEQAWINLGSLEI